MKRLFDIISSTIGIVCLSPLFLVVAIIIKINSEGPVFYRGIRIGKNEKPFRILKFRTMVKEAEKLGGTSTAESDTRITKVGRFLRKHKIDELPQIFNVFKGEMSFVGPRPEVEEYTSLYTEEEKRILSVRPGITDFASVKFRHLNAILAQSDDPDLYYKNVIRPEKNKLRLVYAQNHSLWTDLKIIRMTLRAVFFG